MRSETDSAGRCCRQTHQVQKVRIARRRTWRRSAEESGPQKGRSPESRRSRRRLLLAARPGRCRPRGPSHLPEVHGRSRRDGYVECPECGINLETGQLSAKQKKKRKRGGPDPDLYYKLAWTDSWEFFKKNWTLGMKLGLFWSFFMSLYVAALFMAAVYCEQVHQRCSGEDLQQHFTRFGRRASGNCGSRSSKRLWNRRTRSNDSTSTSLPTSHLASRH